MAGLVKVLSGVGLATPIAGIVGGVYLATSSTAEDPQVQLAKVKTPSSTEVTSKNTQQSPRTRGQVTTRRKEEKGNCTIIDPLKSVLGVTWQNTWDYYSISCESKGEGQESAMIPNKWKGVFPKSLFKGKNLRRNAKLDIKLEEVETFSEYDTGIEDYPFGVVFTSKKFVNREESSLVGKWNYLDGYDDIEGDKMAAMVKLSQPKSNKLIYLLWDKDRD